MNEQKTEDKNISTRFRSIFRLSIMKTTENLKYSDTYRGIKGCVDQNGAKFHLVVTIRMNELKERIFTNVQFLTTGSAGSYILNVLLQTDFGNMCCSTSSLGRIPRIMRKTPSGEPMLKTFSTLK